MASVQNNDIPDMFNFMKDFWSVTKELWKVEDTKEYWSLYETRASNLCKKYNYHEFVCLQVCALGDYFSKEYKKKFMEENKNG